MGLDTNSEIERERETDIETGNTLRFRDMGYRYTHQKIERQTGIYVDRNKLRYRDR